MIENLKINMFLNNDILKPKSIAINIAKKSIFIDSIKIIIALKTRSIKNVVQRSIHLRKTIIIPFYVKITISVNHLNLSKFKNFLFESNNDLNIFIYAHLMNIFILIVIVRNDKSVLVKISKNFRFEQVSKINFLNVFQIDNCEKNVRELIVKHRKFFYQND